MEPNPKSWYGEIAQISAWLDNNLNFETSRRSWPIFRLVFNKFYKFFFPIIDGDDKKGRGSRNWVVAVVKIFVKVFA